MTIIAPEVAKEKKGYVKRKSNNTRHLQIVNGSKQRLSAMLGGAPEVMVKITGFCKGGAHIEAHLTYITRNGKVELENDRDEIFKNKKEVKEFYKEWQTDISVDKKRNKQRDAMKAMFSMPPGTSPEGVRKAVKNFAAKEFKNHEYAFVLHTDKEHPHVHLVVKMKGFDGKYLNPRKADLQRWREGFAENLRALGIDAEATPRNVRGIVKKAEKGVIRHIQDGDKTHKPRKVRVEARAISEAVDELINEQKGRVAPVKPWEEKIKIAQASIREAWLKKAENLTKKIALNQGVKQNEQQRRINRIVARHIYKPDIDAIRGEGQTQSLAGLRNLPNINVVFKRIRSEMLLQQDAHNRLGWNSTGDSEVRRSRNVAGSVDERKRVMTDLALAKKINEFVAAMPPVLTAHQERKQKLANEFTKSNKKTKETPLDNGKQSGIDKSSSKDRDKDLDR